MSRLAVGFFAVAVIAAIAGFSAVVVAALFWLATINGVLAVFNLVPATPLDGGRILAAVLWRRRGDRTSAQISAAHAGRVFVYVLVGLGLLEFAAGDLVGGVWLAFLGWFVVSAAHAEESSVRVRHDLEGIAVGAVMTRDPIVAPQDVTIGELVDDYMMRHPCSSFPLVDAHGSVVAFVTLRQLKAAAPARDRGTPAIAVARSIGDVVRARPDEAMLVLLERMHAADQERALVFEGERLVGIVSPSDVARAAHRGAWRGAPGAGDRHERIPPPPPPTSPPTRGGFLRG